MTSKDFSEALGQIDHSYITDAITYRSKKRIWLPLAAAAACICLIGAMLILPFAAVDVPHSEVYYGEGTPLCGLVITDGSEDLITQNIQITLNLDEFPSGARHTKDDYLSYCGSATMEYTFHNPTNEVITAELLLPCGEEPLYAYTYDYETNSPIFNADGEKYQFSVDGEQISAVLRCTGLDNAPLPQGEWQLGVFSDDAPVTKLTYRATGLDSYSLYYVSFWVQSFPNCFVLYDGAASGSRINDSYQVKIASTEDNTYVFYVIGEVPDNLYGWYFYGDRDLDNRLEGSMELISSQTMTFADYGRMTYDESRGISLSDWCCSIAGALTDRAYKGFEDYPLAQLVEYSGEIGCRWYEFALTLEPGQTCVVTAVRPVYPGLLLVTPTLCDYTLDTGSLSTLLPETDIELVINTPFEMTDSSADAFVQTDTGYCLTIPANRKAALTFSLVGALPPSETEPPSISGWLILCGLILITAIPVGWVIKKRRTP